MIYLKIDDGVVTNRIVAEGELPPEWFSEGETWVADDEAQIGWTYDGSTFTAPQAPASEPGPVIVPYAVFRDRWEQSEIQALFALQASDWRVQDVISRALAQGHVNLSSATAAAAKALFVNLGALSSERADVIFDTGV